MPWDFLETQHLRIKRDTTLPLSRLISLTANENPTPTIADEYRKAAKDLKFPPDEDDEP